MRRISGTARQGSSYPQAGFKLRPNHLWESCPMRALSLTAPASAAAVAIYRKRCTELNLVHRLADPVYTDLLDLAVLLSQRVIEGRKLRLTILMLSEDL